MIKNILLLSVVFFMNYTFGQNQSGQVTYIGYLNQKHIDSALKDMETKDIPMSHKKFSIDAYNNATDIELILKFKDQKSYYYYNPNLEVEGRYNTTKGIVGTMAYFNDNTSGKIIELNTYIGM